MAGKQSGDDVLSDINVTPLVDVMLVLLVVMMVTASTVVTKSLSVSLPASSNGVSTPRQVVVSVTESGDWLLDDRPITRDALRREVRALRSETEAVSALIAADGAARHAWVVEVLDLLRDERIVQVAVGVVPVSN